MSLMVLSKATPPRIAASRRSVGRPVGAEMRAIEATADRDENREAWGRVIYLTGQGHLSVVADRADLSAHTFGEIRSIATRRLRQINGGDAA